MTPGTGFDLSAFWGPRSDTPAALARRWVATAARLRAIDPVFSNFYKGQDGKGVLLTIDPESIEKDIAARATHDGYMFNVKTDISGRGPRLFEFDMTAGSRFFNVVCLGTPYGQVPDPSIVTYRIFKAAMLAIAENFRVERGRAYPRKLADLWPHPPNANPAFPIAWISYVSARRTHLVTPPPTAIIERRPDGGLLMAATDETFDVDNPAHMAVARDIEAAVAPLNFIPWEPEDPAP